MRLLVLGANGLLGSNVVHAGLRRKWDVCGTYHSAEPDFDIPLVQLSLEATEEFDELLVDYAPDVVVNCAAMTDVDACEQHPEQARLINGDAPGRLAASCAAADIELVHVSTDYVFDGTERTPYLESTEPNPIQAYGESKLVGEQEVRDKHSSALVPRLSFVWGIHRGSNELEGFPAWVLEQLRAGESIPLFTDQWVTPTRAGQAAETILDLIEADAAGRYHVACTSCVTPYEFGERLAARAGISQKLLTGGTTNDVDRDAARPKYSCLEVAAVEDELGCTQPTLAEDIDSIWGDVG